MRALAALLLLLLDACAGAPAAGAANGQNLAWQHRYPGLTCAPFARSVVGVDLHGDAGDWWGEAAGRYRRAHLPEVGSVLVFRRAGRIPAGHVAVVSQVLDRRRILVIQANWTHAMLEEDQLIVDVSPHNDWTEVRVWYPPTHQLGAHVYGAYGFIVPPRPLTHAALMARAVPAAQAVGGS